MPQKRHTVDQIVAKLRKADVELGKGKKVPEICKLLEVTEQTYYRCLRRSPVTPQSIHQRRNHHLVLAHLLALGHHQALDYHRALVRDPAVGTEAHHCWAPTTTIHHHLAILPVDQWEKA